MVIETTEQLLSVPLTQDEQSLVARVRAYDKSEKYLPKLPLAIQFAKTAHAGQKRASGEDFFIHPLIVANTLADISMDSLTIIAALLHDVVEDTEVSLGKIEELFGEKVAFLVDGVTKLTKIEGKSENILQTENFRKLIIAMSKDIRVLIIKLADRLHNMQTLSHLSSITKRGRIALETVDVYANLAERVGMHVIKSQLQDLAFAILHPNSRESIVRRLDLLKRGDSIKLVRKISDTLASLIESHDIEVKVIGREKTPFSIWEKMKRKNISFEQLSDVMAFRVIVPTVPDCYKALWVIHSNYHIVPGRFKDFISLPKENRYRSIHTVIMGPEKQRIEIQIRTVEMHKVAEHGIAAHWGYKQQYKGTDKEGYNWLQGLLNLSESTTNFSDVLENTRTEIYTDQIFCFTPKGAVIALPKGASVVDFAYAVHSELGNACVGAKVNHKMAPLKTKLQNGDQVEITTSQEAKPSPDWEQFSITGKALNEIRKAVKQEKNKELFQLGEALLKTLFIQQNKAFVPEDLEPIAPAFNKATVEELMCAVGDGTIRAEAIWEKLYPTIKLVPLKGNKKRKLTANDDIPIKGLTPGIGIHLAPCCSPILGDRIVGIMLNRKGITVHVSDCETLQHYEEDPNLWVNLSWDKTAAPKNFTGSIKIVLRNIPGALAEVALEIAKNEANISNFKTVSRELDFFEINLDIEIQNQKQLANIISAVKSKHCVHSIERIIR